MGSRSYSFLLHLGPTVGMAGGRLVRIVLSILLAAIWLLLVLVLRVLRPLLVMPLVLTVISAVGTADIFVWTASWRDVAEAGAIAVMSAAALVIYSSVAAAIDPGHFESRLLPNWKCLL